jgi:selenide,water dikinase
VLLGIGHTNAHVLAAWRSSPLADTRLTCVSPFPVATYSGMLPGVLAGQYAPQSMEIDLLRLCAAAGARLVVGEASGIDMERRRLLLHDGSALRFDALSVGIGSIPTFRGVTVDGDAAIVAAKPMQTFLARLSTRLATVCETRPGPPLTAAVVGGGAAGIELALCLPEFLRQQSPPGTRLAMTLVAGADLLPGSASGTVARARAALDRHGVVVHGRRVVRVSDDGLTLDDATGIPADMVVWVTSAMAPPWLATLGLPTDDRGFLLTDATLRTPAGAPIFAVGDTGTIRGAGLAKAGVYAVRQGPVLWRNLTRWLRGAPLESYRPQASFLALLNTGDGRAIGEWHGLSFEGRAAWRLKDHIDRSFMARYQIPV